MTTQTSSELPTAGAAGVTRSPGQLLLQRSGSTLRTYLPAIVIFVVATVVWEAIVWLFKIDVFLLPAPHRIFQTFGQRYPLLFEYGMNTFAQALGGFAIGCGLGILVAIIATRWTLLADLLLPVAVATNSIPIIAFAPVAIVWFGIGPGSKIAIVAVMCFFPTMISTFRGLRSAPPASVELMRSYAAPELDIFFKLRLPAALPYIFTAFKLCATLSMIGAIVAEFFGGSTKLLGVYIKTEASILRTTNAWAAIIVACLLGLAFYLAISLIERLVMPWHISFREGGHRGD
jgi:NitT/TauT family transport system permease protein